MSLSRSYRVVAGLGLVLGLLVLPAAQAAPAGRSFRDGEPIGLQVERVVRTFLRPIANLLGAFQMDNRPGQSDPPRPNPQEGVGLDPFGKPGPPGPP